MSFGVSVDFRAGCPAVCRYTGCLVLLKSQRFPGFSLSRCIIIIITLAEVACDFQIGFSGFVNSVHLFGLLIAICVSVESYLPMHRRNWQSVVCLRFVTLNRCLMVAIYVFIHRRDLRGGLKVFNFKLSVCWYSCLEFHRLLVISCDAIKASWA